MPMLRLLLQLPTQQSLLQKRQLIIDLRDLSTSLSARRFNASERSSSSPACMNMAFRGLRVFIDLGTDLAASRFRAAAAEAAHSCRQTSQNTSPQSLGINHQGLARGGSTTKGSFLLDTRLRFPRPQTNCEHRSEARTRLAWGNTEAKEPRALVTPGVPELSLILGSRLCGGVSGDGCHTASTRTAAASLSGGWGCRTVSLTTQG